jgi:5-methylcytosine-specific restriction protein B
MKVVSDDLDVPTAAAEFDRAAAQTAESAVEDQRQQVLRQFPLASWPSLPLERYALGQQTSGGTTYCRLLEFGTPMLGSIKGGSAAKHIMFRHNTGEWRLAAPLDGLEPREAWGSLRRQFVQAFDAVAGQDFDALDELDLLRYGPALVTKSLATYFPEEFLPIYSADHLRRFLRLLNGLADGNSPTWLLNRQLRDAVRSRDEFRGWSSHEVMQFLYEKYDPRSTHRVIWKIAPGPGASHWQDCLDGGFICVGWDELGDLGQYQSDRELKAAMDRYWPASAGGNLTIARRLLAFRDLEPGDRLIANRGVSEVLALGTVTDSYRYDEQRSEYRHLVSVDWDTSYAQTLAKRQHGWQSTFAKVNPILFAAISDGRHAVRTAPADADPARVRPLPDDVQAVLDALDRKGQVVLYGPPGTGKTRRALHAALAIGGRRAAIGDSPSKLVEQLNALLDQGNVRMVTFHPSYGYEDFVEGFKPDLHATGAGLTLTLADGLFHQLCRQASRDPEQTFVLIIDEINRGDLPRIFGELVTALERDKRGLPLRLPISGRDFAVPPNICIIATMNTADRSISHLDAAIRRRFAFLPVDPDPDAVSGSIGPLDLSEFLTALNDRIVDYLDADHQIGHAYLLRDDGPIGTDEDLAAAFHHDLVPLLEDACIGRADLLQHLLGTLVDPDTGRPAMMAPQDLAGALAAEFTGKAPADA